MLLSFDAYLLTWFTVSSVMLSDSLLNMYAWFLSSHFTLTVTGTASVYFTSQMTTDKLTVGLVYGMRIELAALYYNDVSNPCNCGKWPDIEQSIVARYCNDRTPICMLTNFECSQIFKIIWMPKAHPILKDTDYVRSSNRHPSLDF